MKPVISIGNQDFGSIRENGYFYVDKTDFIQEWWENGRFTEQDVLCKDWEQFTDEDFQRIFHSGYVMEDF